MGRVAGGKANASSAFPKGAPIFSFCEYIVFFPACRFVYFSKYMFIVYFFRREKRNAIFNHYIKIIASLFKRTLKHVPHVCVHIIFFFEMKIFIQNVFFHLRDLHKYYHTNSTII